MGVEKLIDSLEHVSQFLGENALKVQEDVFNKFVRDNVIRINKELISKGLIMKGIVVFNEKWGNESAGINIMSNKVYPMVTFEEELSVAEKLRLFESNILQIEETALEAATTIHKNRLMYEEVFSEILSELKKEEGFPNPELLALSFDCYYADLDGIGQLIIRYDKKLIYSMKTFLYMKKNRFSSGAKIMFQQEIVKAWNNILHEQKALQLKELKKYLLEVLGTSNFIIVENLPNNTLFDIDQKKISIHFDLSNKELKKLFEFSIQEVKEKIYLLENAMELPEKVEDIFLSKRFFFIFKEERKTYNDIYRLYECRGVRKKCLLVVFKNGIRLSGRPRRRVLQALGYGKQFQPTK